MPSSLNSFVIVGAQVALEASLNYFIAVILEPSPALGSGVLRDVLTEQTGGAGWSGSARLPGSSGHASSFSHLALGRRGIVNLAADGGDLRHRAWRSGAIGDCQRLRSVSRSMTT